jgi:hypothetical protein
MADPQPSRLDFALESIGLVISIVAMITWGLICRGAWVVRRRLSGG